MTRDENAEPENQGLSGTPGHARNAVGSEAKFAMSATSRPPMSSRNKAASKSVKSVDVVIPDKLYFRIGEVAQLCRLPAYVLRFWELRPVKGSTGQRMYRHKDVENVLRIKKLLYEEGFTIAGARQHLRAENKVDKKQTPLPFPERTAPDLKQIRQGLREILAMLSPRQKRA